MTSIDMHAISFCGGSSGNASLSKSKRSAITSCNTLSVGGRSASRPVPKSRSVLGETLDDYGAIEIVHLNGPSPKEPLCLLKHLQTGSGTHREKFNGESARVVRLTIIDDLMSSRWQINYMISPLTARTRISRVSTIYYVKQRRYQRRSELVKRGRL